MFDYVIASIIIYKICNLFKNESIFSYFNIKHRRGLDVVRRSNLRQSEMQRYKILQKAAFQRDIKLHLCPGVFQRHRDNISFYFTKKRLVLWCCEVLFVRNIPNSGLRALRHLSLPIPETQTVLKAIKEAPWKNPFLVDFIEETGNSLKYLFESCVIFVLNKRNFKKGVYKKKLPPNLRYYNEEGNKMQRDKEIPKRKQIEIEQTKKDEAQSNKNQEISGKVGEHQELKSEILTKSVLTKTSNNEKGDQNKMRKSIQNNSSNKKDPNNFEIRESVTSGVEINPSESHFFEYVDPLKVVQEGVIDNPNSINMKTFSSDSIGLKDIKIDEEALIQINTNLSLNENLSGTYINEYPTFYLVQTKDLKHFLHKFQMIGIINEF